MERIAKTERGVMSVTTHSNSYQNVVDFGQRSRLDFQHEVIAASGPLDRIGSPISHLREANGDIWPGLGGLMAPPARLAAVTAAAKVRATA